MLVSRSNPQCAERSPTQRLHGHVRRHLSGWPAELVSRAIAVADGVFADGAGHMQTALDAGIAAAVSLAQAGAA